MHWSRPRRWTRSRSSLTPWSRAAKAVRRPTKALSPSLFPTSTRTPKPPAVAITGAIGAGKSAALESFARHGAATISSDEIVHSLLSGDTDVRRELVEQFGPDVIGSDGADRAKIAEIVFNDPDQLDWLEELLHPRVVRENLAWRAEVEGRPEPPLLTVTEVPLLYETGGERRFDAVVVISAPEELRRERRPVGDAREQRLLPAEEKAARADYAYVNDGTLEELDAFVADVVARLTA
jgi:dephospho-CoA kinase